MTACPFCTLADRDLVAENDLAVAIRDSYPVTPGHTLIIPRRHVATWFDATAEEREAILSLVDETKAQLDAQLAPDGYNIGINIGEAAGQTVMHLHAHLIPRRTGDVDDPTGGVRLVIPDKGNYRRQGHVPTSRAAPLAMGTRNDPFDRHVRPLFSRAREVAIVAAFVHDSGVRRLEGPLDSLLERGGRARLLTGDYLHSTQAQALRRLLALERGAGLADELACGEAEGEAAERAIDAKAHRGSFELRVIEVAKLGPTATSFHPKAWIFQGGDTDAAFVGSSNLTETALRAGVEWNLRVERQLDAHGFEQVVQAFEQWWARGTVPDEAWLEDYASRARAAAQPLPPGETDEVLERAPEPWPIQQDALDALRAAREEGRDRALVVMATGLGKTLLAAFDVEQFADEQPAVAEFPRVLLLAHRVELLRQAAKTFHRLFPDLRVSWYAGNLNALDGQLVLGSVMKLGREEHLASVPPHAFDYVIVDEVHHADAKTYRRILDHLQPQFRLGLTATPERADAGDIFGLFDDHLAFEADIGRGIACGRLVPFHYFGLEDVVDYASIPWRNRRFDPEALSQAVQTRRRMDKLWDGWQEHPGQRTLVFCCSIPHADFVASWLAERKLRAMSVHSGPSSGDRTEALDRLADGTLQAVCTVDLFNEGIDVPAVDRVVMLRPTESPVVFLQQLGRGLRTDPDTGKDALTVIDLVGNHRVFLDRVRTLLSLAPDVGRAGLRACLEQPGPVELPHGCSVDIELGAIDLLRKLMPSGDQDVLKRTYRELRYARGLRPTLGELYRLGLNPRSIKDPGGWFGLVESEGDLTDAERRVFDVHGDWLAGLERDEAMQKSYKMITVQALIEAEQLHEGLSTEELAARSLQILKRSPELLRDAMGVKELGDIQQVPPDRWHRYWLRNPIHFWTAGQPSKKTKGRRFRVTDGRFVPTWTVDEPLRATFAEMTREIVDYRLTRYRKTRRDESALTELGAFECKIITNKRAPILMLPDRDAVPQIPRGETDVRLPDGRFWRFRFAKVACNVAHPVGKARNELADLLRGWFGPNAGKPSTSFKVRFAPIAGDWWVEPVEAPDAEVIPLAPRGKVMAFPTLRAAAGLEGQPQPEIEADAEPVALPVGDLSEGVFAVRASGTSMDGWRSEIRDGDWLVMRWAQGAGLGAVRGRVALVGRGPADEGQSFHLKRVGQRGGQVWLDSDNPDVQAIAATADDRPLALLERSIHPEALGPPVGSLIEPDQITRQLGVIEPPSGAWSRVDGHLFLQLGEDSAGARLVAPDRVEAHVPERRIAETAFVLARAQQGDGWRYCGVGRWLDDERLWAIPEVDFATWRAHGGGRTASRRLDDRWLQAAQEVVAARLEQPGPGGWLERDGKRCRIVRQAPKGGLVIDGGEGGFRERTVSLTDIGWVLAAQQQGRPTGAMVDEATVNRVRYLEGTPKGATRWIDTGWALVVVG